jgi:hypothetical protein
MAAMAVVAWTPAAARQIDAGVTGGINVANLALGDGADVSFDHRIGLVAGGFVTFPLRERLSLQPEVLFSQKGAAFDEFGATGRIELDALDVPVLARYQFGRLFVVGGPSLSLKLRARQVLEFGDDEEAVDLEDDVESFDFGVVGGVGYQFGRISVHGRYTWGLRNINAVEGDEATIKTRTLTLLAGWRF